MESVRSLRSSGCRLTWIAPVAMCVVMLAWGSRCLAQVPKLYFTNDWYDKIERCRLDGSAREDLVTTGSSPRGIALDVVGGKMYWTDWSENRVKRSDLNGSNVETLLDKSSGEPLSIALDLPRAKIYWVQNESPSIWRANLDGTAEELVVQGVGGDGPVALAVDYIGQKLYWTDDRDEGSIRRASLDGSGEEFVLCTGLVNANSLALDLAGQTVYWADNGLDMIQRCGFDGSGKEALVTLAEDPHAICLDLDAGKMYWTEYFLGTMQRSDLDGSDIETIIDSGIRDVWGIAIVPEPAALSLLALGGLAVLRRRGH